MQGIIKIGRAKERFWTNRKEKKTTRSTQEANVLAETRRIIEPWKKFQLILRFISNFTENYPCKWRRGDKRIKVEEIWSLSPFIKRLRNWRTKEKSVREKIVDRYESEAQAPLLAISNVENKDYKLPYLIYLKFPKNKQVYKWKCGNFMRMLVIRTYIPNFSGVKAKVTKVLIEFPCSYKIEVYPW